MVGGSEHWRAEGPRRGLKEGSVHECGEARGDGPAASCEAPVDVRARCPSRRVIASRSCSAHRSMGHPKLTSAPVPQPSIRPHLRPRPPQTPPLNPRVRAPVVPCINALARTTSARAWPAFDPTLPVPRVTSQFPASTMPPRLPRRMPPLPGRRAFSCTARRHEVIELPRAGALPDRSPPTYQGEQR